MKKSDLRTGMIVTLRNGETYMVFRDCLYGYGKDVLVSEKNSWFNLDSFNEDLTLNDDENWEHMDGWDIVKVECTEHPYSLVKRYGKNKTVWERQEAKKMTVAEIEAILGYKVEVVSEK